ncbi:hypothetical protein JTB14_037134 [Gonioctena quinquepunctata]|nr:hypothetical protein JTB14_037134 [Gonioctena quinquepunctata]
MPKQEVASRLALHAEQLKNKELMRWLGEVDKENRGSVYSWHPMPRMQERVPEKREEGRVDTATELRNLPDDNRSRLGKGNISKNKCRKWTHMGTPNEYDIILPCNAEFESLENEVSSAITKFGGEDGLRRQNKTKGDVAMMLHSLGFPREDGSFICSPRYIYYPITTDGIGTKEAEDIDVFQSIVQIRNHILENKKTKVALPELNGVGGMMLGRIEEYLFVNTNVEVKMYKPVNSQKLLTQDSTQANSQISKQNTGLLQIPSLLQAVEDLTSQLGSLKTKVENQHRSTDMNKPDSEEIHTELYEHEKRLNITMVSNLAENGNDIEEVKNYLQKATNSPLSVKHITRFGKANKMVTDPSGLNWPAEMESEVLKGKSTLKGSYVFIDPDYTKKTERTE